MKQITSTNFARQYPRLTEPHEVTALGRPIGMWIPTGFDPGQLPKTIVPYPGYKPMPTGPDPGKKR